MAKIYIKYKGDRYKVTLTDENINIEDSYKIKSTDGMKSVLGRLISRFPDNKVLSTRYVSSMLNEWKAHNLLYALGIEKYRTKSVDLDLRETKFRRMCYKFLSLFYFSCS